MELSMVGIDYTTAAIGYREIFSLTASAGRALASRFLEKYGAKGCIILSTCNRTELWFSGLKGSPKSLFLAEKDASEAEYGSLFTERHGKEAVRYLMELSCGMHSQIYGEDQILAQVKTALITYREYKSTDAVLETLFRQAITAAKKVKTQVQLSAKDTSVPQRAISLLERQTGSLAGKKCLVIGNGEMGRLTAASLIDHGCEVTMTLRQYKKKEAIIPKGCGVINYDERYDMIGQADCIFSATLSPHFTVTKKQLCDVLEQGHSYTLIDLAVPRDMEPEINELPGVTLFDMDSLGVTASCNEDQIKEAASLLEECEEDFYNWYHFRQWIPKLEEIGERCSETLNGKLKKTLKTLGLDFQAEKELQQQIQRASRKTVESMIFGIKETLPSDQWESCISALLESVRNGR